MSIEVPFTKANLEYYLKELANTRKEDAERLRR